MEDQEEFINGDIDHNCDEQQTVASNFYNVFIGGGNNPTFLVLPPPYDSLTPQTSTKDKIKSQSRNKGITIGEEFVAQEHSILPTKICPITIIKYPKPDLPFRFLILLALKNSQTGCLYVSEIYKFISHHFPYYENVSKPGWKNSIRHTLSFCKAFLPIKCQPSQQLKKGNMWSLNAVTVGLLEFKLRCRIVKNGLEIKKSMSNPAILELMVEGGLKECFVSCCHSEYQDKDENLLKGNSIMEITESAFVENEVLPTTSKCKIIHDEDVKIEVKEEWRAIEDIPEENCSEF